MKYIYSGLAVACIVAYTFNHEAILLLAAVMFHINATELRIIQSIEAKQ